MNTKHITARIPDELYKLLETFAKDSRRSRSNAIVLILEKFFINYSGDVE